MEQERFYSGVPDRMIRGHYIKSWSMADSERGIVSVTDQDGRHSYLWHVRKLDKKGEPPFYLSLLDDDEPWSDILAPFADEGTFCLDSCDIIRIRSQGNWFGFRLSPDGGYPIRFQFCEEQLNRVVVIFVHPFRNGFAKAIVREHKEKIPGEGRRIAHVLCGTDGKIFGNFSFKYLFPEREWEPGHAKVYTFTGHVIKLRLSDGLGKVLSEPEEGKVSREMRLLDERAAEENEELGKNLRKLFPPLSVKDSGIKKALRDFGVRKTAKVPAEGAGDSPDKTNGVRTMPDAGRRTDTATEKETKTKEENF